MEGNAKNEEGSERKLRLHDLPDDLQKLVWPAKQINMASLPLVLKLCKMIMDLREEAALLSALDGVTGTLVRDYAYVSLEWLSEVEGEEPHKVIGETVYDVLHRAREIMAGKP
jgi:hypothetical protein